MNMNTIGERIAQFRKEKNMTQEEFSAILGVSAQTVSKWENSTTMPDIMLLPIIADIFDISIDELYGKTISKHSLSFNDVPEASYDALLMTMHYAWIKNEEAMEKTKEYLLETPCAQTAIYSDDGSAVYANSELGLIFRKPSGKPSDLLLDESNAAFLAKLSDNAFRKMLVYLIDNHTISFTAASAAAKCGITTEEAATALDGLTDYNLASRQSVDVGEEQIRIYRLFGGHKLLLIYTILKLAKRLTEYNEHYRGFRGTPHHWFC